MKKIRLFLLLLCLGLLLCLAACSGDRSGAETEAAGTTAEASGQETAPETGPLPETQSLPEPSEDPGEIEIRPASGTTVMIYMIGSDLESKKGAGTEDLQEIEQSGVDLSACNVAVYAGGSQRWHREPMKSGDDGLLYLTEAGFTAVETLESRSMGEPETLAAFLTDCVERFPAEHYVLILWDHGNGPLIGYGRDTAFENDRMTLSEMQQALEASPFGGELRLDWVGFDACLMSSAELALIFRDYADYLAASQELEPSFGWPYAFLADLNTKPTEELLKGLAEDYLADCLDYFERKGYQDREGTLACMDLRRVGGLETAVNTLFEAAAADLPTGYDAIARSRDNTWDVGKVATGSDYDLVDLADLCEILRDRYPLETAAVETALEDTVVCSATNGERLCGVSMFFPFYNKVYYEKEWRETYRRMDLFSGYQRFLTRYGEVWLRSDMLDNFARSTEPAQEASGLFTLELTPDQVQHFSSARYYILERISGEVFLREFVGADVELREDRLEASFNGSVIYVRNKTTGQIMIPAVEEIGHTDRTIYYTASALGLTSDNYALALMGAGTDGIRFYLALDRQTGEIRPMSIQPAGRQTKADLMVQGRKDEVDLTEYTALCWDVGRPCFLTKTENGVILSFQDWKESYEFRSYGGVNLADGFEFCYGPVPGEQYALMFEIRDTQGNLYCSEPLDLPGEKAAVSEPEIHKVTADLSGGGAVLLEKDGIVLRLERGSNEAETLQLRLTVENRTEKAVGLSINGLLYNGTYSGSAMPEDPSKSIRPGETGSFILYLGPEVLFYNGLAGLPPQVRTLSLRMSLYSEDEDEEYFVGLFGLNKLYETIWDDLQLDVDITGIEMDDVEIPELLVLLNQSLYDAVAEPQILAESEEFRATLTGAVTYEELCYLFVLVENYSDHRIQVRCRDAVIDGMVSPTQTIWGTDTSIGGLNATPPIPPGKQAVMLVTLDEDNLLLSLYHKPGDLKLGLSLNRSTVSDDYFQLTEYTDEFYWCGVALQGAAENGQLQLPLDSLRLLCAKNGVAVWLVEQYDNGESSLYAVNSGDASVNIQISDLAYDDEEPNSAVRQMLSSDLGPGMKSFLQLDLSDASEDHEEVKFKFTFLDVNKNAVLWQSNLLRLPYHPADD